MYVADTAAMNTAGCPLLAVEATAETTQAQQEFRIEAGSVTLVHGNLAIGHIGFGELVERAADEPDGVIRD